MAKKVTDIASLRLRKRVRTGKIVLAPQSEVEKFDPDFIDDFLDRIFECSGVQIEFMGEVTAGRVIFGPDDAEPLLGVTALESVGITVDPANRTWKRLPAIPLR